ncbi:VOC family protein [Amycolatopsis sp. EV170708-02-1]|uniref:VOC family protein n=1 Tax=Amycolatopsis sp. EV170708-02-1 TaxID=2919322 RepID=UPI001F0B8521|nr:hypothetical protein [Amycolatopsis sp. EV170708-02-1]UMP06750.1 hypothetical protein MJQ72_18915 [Amycolatopsis sp. EV170708-02-1]
MSKVYGLTISIHVSDLPNALSYYSALLDRAPDNFARGDRPEWEICEGAWFQLVGGCDVVVLASRVRFEVADVAAEIARLRSIGIEVTEPTTLPGVAIFTDFEDPWGNPLGIYHDFVGAEAQSPMAEG